MGDFLFVCEGTLEGSELYHADEEKKNEQNVASDQLNELNAGFRPINELNVAENAVNLILKQ